MNKEPIWWEKTVEYLFVLEAERKVQLKFAAPLSGVQERAGDAIFSSDSTIVLIEFKRSVNELNSEFDKFVDYEVASEDLAVDDKHHILVYGSAETTQRSEPPELTLCARQYFSRTDIPTVMNVFSQGLPEMALREYLAKLLTYKKADGRSSGTVGPESVAAAFGVSSITRTGTSISLSEYYRRVMPSLVQSNSPVNRSNHPRPGGV